MPSGVPSKNTKIKAFTNIPTHIGITDRYFSISPYNIIHDASICRIPKTIIYSGLNRYVTRVTPSAISPNFTPLSRFDFDRLQAMPDMTINPPANHGSAGMNISISLVPHEKPNMTPAI